MSADVHDGGPAFPPSVAISPAGDTYYGDPGMTLRDWFAGQALGGLIASEAPDAEWQLLQVSQLAYRVADVMLAARGEPK